MTDSTFAGSSTANPWFRAALGLIAGVAMMRLVALSISPIALYADETQYWIWSREFDWGYFSKPPMIAWLIAVSTGLLGDSDFAVRLPAPLLHSATAAFLFASAQRLADARTGFWAAAVYLTLPSIWLSGVVISTDALLLCAWSAGLYSLLCLREDGGRVSAMGLGLAIGLGFLSKYAMIYFVVGTAVAIVIDAPLRRALLSLKGAIATLIALACLTPNLAWNAANDFATVSHTAANANWGGDLFHPAEMAEFLVEQVAVFGPVLFPVLVGLLIAGALKFRDIAPERRLLAAFIVPAILAVSIQAFISRAHANWAAGAYVGATLLVTLFLLNGPGWRRAVLIGSIVLHSIVGISFAVIAASPVLVEMTGLDNATKRIRAWPETAAAIAEAADADDYAFIVFDDRNVFHQTQRYAPSLQTDMRMWLRYSGPMNHAEDIWPLPETVDGPVLIVSHRPLEVPRLRDDFSDFRSVGELAIPLDGGRTRDFTLWRAEGHIRVERDATYENRWQAIDAEAGVVRGYSDDDG